jgi:chaperonin GroEL
VGINIVRRALQAPAARSRTTRARTARVVGKLRDSKDADWGFNAQTGEYAT